MKKLFGFVLSIIIVFSLTLITPVYADNGVIIVSQKNVNIGDTVSVMLTYNSTEALLSVSGTLTFDANILKYTAGGTSCLNNTVNIKETVKNGSKNLAYSITFTAIAAGNNSFTFNMKGNKANGAASDVTQSAVITVANNGDATANKTPDTDMNNDPLAVTVDSKNYKIVNDVISIPEIPNFTRSVTKYKDLDINTLTDVNGKYVFFYLLSTETNKADWFVKDDSDNFSRLKYISFQDKMYIIEEETDSLLMPPENWISSEYEISEGVNAKCYKSTKSSFADFRIFHCYYDGESSFYRYDTTSSVLQLDPEFALVNLNHNNEKKGDGIWGYYQGLSEEGRLFAILCGFELIAIIILIIALIVKHKKKKKYEKEKQNNS